LRFGILQPDDLPQEELAALGGTGARRIDTLVNDLVESSERAGDIVQSEEIGRAMVALRAFMFERVYLGPHARGEQARARRVVTSIFDYLVARGDDADAIVSFVSGMTDRFAIEYEAAH
jgi:dGTPase